MNIARFKIEKDSVFSWWSHEFMEETKIGALWKTEYGVS